jgi:hypothetical protein
MLKKQLLSLDELFNEGHRSRARIAEDLFSNTRSDREVRHVCYWLGGSDEGMRDEPNAIEPSGDDADTLFADVATYFPEMSPISSHIHIISDEYKVYLDASNWIEDQKGYANRLPQTLWNICIGLIVAEASNSAFLAGDPEGGVTYSVCRRSLGFTLARGMFLYPALAGEVIGSRWLKLRQASKMDASVELSATLVWIVNLAFGNDARGGLGGKDGLGRYVENLIGFARGKLSEHKILEDVQSDYPAIGKYLVQLKGTFDSRITAIEGVIAEVRRKSNGTMLDSIVIGLCCNQVLPGSLEHTRILARYLREFPAILLWYGFFAGASAEFDARFRYSGVGKKLMRDIKMNFDLQQRPTCDVSLDELVVLSRVTLKDKQIRPVQPRAMLVSVLPGIEVFSRLPTDESIDSRQDSLQFESGGAHADRLIFDRVSNLLLEAQTLLSNRTPTSTGLVPTKSRRAKSVDKKIKR